MRERNANRPLIVFYSYSGNTCRIAEVLWRLTGGEQREIYPLRPYPAAFPELLEQVQREVREKYCPRLILPSVSADRYDVIFVGSPNWCGTIAPPLYAWLRLQNLSGKTVMPFCSHCGGVPGNMRRDVARLCPKADVREPLSVISGGGEALGEKAARWLEENGMKWQEWRMDVRQGVRGAPEYEPG